LKIRNSLPSVWKGFKNIETHAAAAGAALLRSLQRATHSLSELFDSAATVPLVATAIPAPVLDSPSFPSYPRSSKTNMQHKGRKDENLGVYDSNLERENLKNHDYTLFVRNWVDYFLSIFHKHMQNSSPSTRSLLKRVCKERVR
jgi:hypothetical protein